VTSFYATAQSEPLPVYHEYSCNRRRKACMGWSWAAACGVQGRRHIARLPAQHGVTPYTIQPLTKNIKGETLRVTEGAAK